MPIWQFECMLITRPCVTHVLHISIIAFNNSLLDASYFSTQNEEASASNLETYIEWWMCYLVDEFAHFCDSWCAFLETLEVVRREDEVPLLPLREELVSLLPQQTFLDRGRGPLLLKTRSIDWSVFLEINLTNYTCSYADKRCQIFIFFTPHQKRGYIPNGHNTYVYTKWP
jgi:hypothetical protein